MREVYKVTTYANPIGGTYTEDICYNCGKALKFHFQRDGAFCCWATDYTPYNETTTQGGNLPSKEFKDNLKYQVESNPAWFIGASAALLAGLAKLWEAKTHAKQVNTYAKNVNRLTKKDRRR